MFREQLISLGSGAGRSKQGENGGRREGEFSRDGLREIKRDTVRRDCFRNTIAALVSRGESGRKRAEVCGEVN